MSMTQADMAGAPAPMGAEQAPMPEAAPDTGQVMNEMEQQRMAELEAVAASAPQPEKPFTTSLVKKLVDEMNDFLVNVDPDIAEIEFLEDAARIDGPLPPEVYVPFVLILSALAQFEEKQYEKYMMNPEEFVNDAAVRKAIAMVQMMGKDEELIDDLQRPAGAGEEDMAPEEPMAEETMEPMPGEMDETDEALMETM
jgi:hypothetical protein